MKITIDYNEHPDLGGPQRIFEALTKHFVDISEIIGKKIVSVEFDDSLNLLIELCDDDELAAKFSELSSKCLNLETDRDHYELVFKGEWPSSVELLENALRNAREKALKKNLKEAIDDYKRRSSGD